MWGLITGLVIGLTRLGRTYITVTWQELRVAFQARFLRHQLAVFCGLMFLFCVLVIVVVSLFTEAPPLEKIQGLVFGTATPEQKAETRASWNHWDIIHTVIILGITVAFYIYFW